MPLRGLRRQVDALPRLTVSPAALAERLHPYSRPGPFCSPEHFLSPVVAVYPDALVPDQLKIAVNFAAASSVSGGIWSYTALRTVATHADIVSVNNFVRPASRNTIQAAPTGICGSHGNTRSIV
jgi:hypothetical protein